VTFNKELSVAKDFLPTRNADLLEWSAGFIANLTVAPTTVGCTAPQCVAYQALHDSFAADLAVSTNALTRTRTTIEATNTSRDLLKANARELARIINAFPGTTNEERLSLGLNPRAGEISPINPPTEPPILEVISAIGRTLKVRLHAQDSSGRAKPEGVDGASIFSFVGNSPPADISEWTFEASTSRTSFDVEFPPTVPAGSQVFLCSFWFSPRKQSGPACTPVSAYIAGGVGSQAA
jgi:hypothetical protein